MIESLKTYYYDKCNRVSVINMKRLGYINQSNEPRKTMRIVFIGTISSSTSRANQSKYSIFHFLESGFLPTLIRAITKKKQKLINEANYLATDNNLISMLLLKCVSSEIYRMTFCNLNWSYICQHMLLR